MKKSIHEKPLAGEMIQHAELLAAIVESSNDAIIGKSLDGVVTSWNKAAERIYGYSADEAIGSNVQQLLIPEDLLVEEANILARIRRGEVVPHLITRRRCRDGRLIDVSITVSPIHGANGEIIGASKTARDITDQKLAEERITTLNATLESKVAQRTAQLEIAKVAAESATMAKSEFVANMSHEIRTPMNAVLGLTYLLEKLDLPDEAADLVGKIRNAGRLLLGIINDILDFSKIESGKLDIEQAPFRLSDVLTNIATVMASGANDKNIELIITPPPGGIEHLQGDSLRLEQVLINLAGNAVKFTNEGHVNILVTVDEADPERVTLRFAVLDTGIGIAADRQKDLFRPFTQVDTSTTRRFGGTGLGLAISRRLVALMGGEIGLVSAPGRGSEFWFTLPFERQASTILSSPELADLEVLIVDDNNSVQEALRITATHLGWKTTCVGSGHAAVNHVLARPAGLGRNDVILLDWQMPDMDGLETAGAIRKSLNGKRESIILLVTAYSRKDLLSQPEIALVDSVLSKPVTASTLYDAVAHVLHARQNTAKPKKGPTAMARLAGVRMLIVDDSDINREVAQRIFAGEGAQVSLASDGTQALEWLNAHSGQVDIVLMDVQMPVMDGYEATRNIRKQPEFAGLPVVALTAGAFKAQQTAAFEAGMTDYIAKPFDVEIAIALIQRLTSRAGGIAGAVPPVQTEVPDAASRRNDLPGLGVGRGLAVWKDVARYQTFLRKFANEYGDSARILAQVDVETAAALAHKLKGAAGSLRLEEVAAAAGAVDLALRAGVDAVTKCAALQVALDTALASIARYAPATMPDAAPVGETLLIDGENVSSLLSRLLRGYGSDDPAMVEPLIDELASTLTPTCLVHLRNAIDNFDFRRGEAATRTLAAHLGIFLKE